jgi:hypothetical protein
MLIASARQIYNPRLLTRRGRHKSRLRVGSQVPSLPWLPFYHAVRRNYMDGFKAILATPAVRVSEVLD